MPRTVLVAAIVAAAAAAAPPASAEWVMAERLPGRETDVLSAHAADHADLLMRALDSNSDWRLDASGADLSPEAVRQHLPGVEVSQFASFLQLADADRDGKVDRPELARALATGFAGAGNTELLQIDEQNRGFFDTIKNFGKAVLGNVKNKINIAGNRILGKVDVTQDACVMCQYIVERLETNVRQSGVIPNMPTGDVPLYVSTSNDNPFSPYAPRPPAGHGGFRAGGGGGGGRAESSESSARVTASTTGTTTNADGTSTLAAPTDKAFLLEVEAKTEAKDPYDAAGAGIIAASRESTRMQRQMERQKYNEIYRVVDITLDDVCEQGMPAPFYGYCKQIYQVQSDIVDGLRYQYRPADICFRVGMCGKESYITKGIHSRYQA